MVYTLMERFSKRPPSIFEKAPQPQPEDVSVNTNARDRATETNLRIGSRACVRGCCRQGEAALPKAASRVPVFANRSTVPGGRAIRQKVYIVVSSTSRLCSSSRGASHACVEDVRKRALTGQCLRWVLKSISEAENKVSGFCEVARGVMQEKRH